MTGQTLVLAGLLPVSEHPYRGSLYDPEVWYGSNDDSWYSSTDIPSQMAPPTIVDDYLGENNASQMPSSNVVVPAGLLAEIQQVMDPPPAMVKFPTRK